MSARPTLSPFFRDTPRPMKKKSSQPIHQHASLLQPSSWTDRNAPLPRAMLYPVGPHRGRFKKPIIGIASTWSNVTPCNMHIDKPPLESERAECSLRQGIVFNPSPISDGISDGQRRHEIFARLTRSHRRLHRDRRGLRRHGRLCGHRRLRTSTCPAPMICIARNESPCCVRLWRTILPGCLTAATAARHRQTKAKTSMSSPYSKPSVNTPRARSATKNCTPWNPARFPGRFMWRHVHRQHHGQRD